MEALIELDEEEFDAISGGAGSATFSFLVTASGNTAQVSGTLIEATTPTSAMIAGVFTSYSSSQ